MELCIYYAYCNILNFDILIVWVYVLFCVYLLLLSNLEDVFHIQSLVSYRDWWDKMSCMYVWKISKATVLHLPL